jgi:PGF-CTERM protein
MAPDRPRGFVLVVAAALVLAGFSAPGLAQPVDQSEQEPNDSPLNATVIAPGGTINGELSQSANASGADADWYAFPIQANQSVSITLESGNNSERLLVFLASPNLTAAGAGGGSAVPDNGTNATTGANGSNTTNGTAPPTDALDDAQLVPSGGNVTLTTSSNSSGLYLLGVTGLSGQYNFTVATNATGGVNAPGGLGFGNATNGSLASGSTSPSASAGGGSGAASETPSTTPTATRTPTETATETATGTPETTGSADGSETSASGPGFGPLLAVGAILAVALLAVRRR